MKQHRKKVRELMRISPNEWLQDSALRSCSIEARGAWMDLMGVMSESSPPGETRIGGNPATLEGLARICGVSSERMKLILDELVAVGLCRLAKDGVYQSDDVRQRVEKMNHVRSVRAQSGKLGAATRELARKPQGSEQAVQETAL